MHAEVLICVLSLEGPPFGKITEMQAGEEFSCSQHRSERSKVDRLHRFDAAALRKHHSRDRSEAASHSCHSSQGFLDYFCDMQPHESRDRRLK
jgi:hypothetical protein